MSANQAAKRIDQQRFKRVNELVAGQWRPYLQAECPCGATDRVPPPPSSTGDQADMAAKHFHAKGWHIASTAKGDRCPECAHPKPKPARPKPTTTPFQVLDAMVEPPPPPPDPKVTPQVVLRASEPRQPSPFDRRRVMEALEEHYDVGRGYYTKSWSDEALAAKIDVPRAWVSAVREMMFGDNGRNEVEMAHQIAVADVDRRLAELADEFLARHAELEAEIKQLGVRGKVY